MKLKGLILGTAISLALLGSTANANVSVQAFSFLGEDACNTADGLWTGSGKITALGGFVNCDYSGTAQITKIDNAGHYNVDVQLHKDSGICPDAERFILEGSCTQGAFTMKTDWVHLSGNLSADGKAVSFSGTANVDVMGQTITADINDMNMHKQ